MSANLRHTSKLRTFRAKNEVQLSTFDNKVGYLELRKNQ